MVFITSSWYARSVDRKKTVFINYTKNKHSNNSCNLKWASPQGEQFQIYKIDDNTN